MKKAADAFEKSTNDFRKRYLYACGATGVAKPRRALQVAERETSDATSPAVGRVSAASRYASTPALKTH